MLPHGTDRESRVAVFAEGDKAREAQEAGADVVGTADLAKQIEEGFDRLRRRDRDAGPDGASSASSAASSARAGRCRTRRPAPSRWTWAKAVQEAKAGKLEYRTDRGANVHVATRQEELRRARSSPRTTRRCSTRSCARKPAGREGPLHQAALRSTTTMGPGIHVDPARTRGHRRRPRGDTGRRSSPRLDKPVAEESWLRESAETQPRRIGEGIECSCRATRLSASSIREEEVIRC